MNDLQNLPELARDRNFYELLTSSHARLVGKPLFDDALGPEWLYRDAPFVVVSHNADADPRFVYANITAQSAFGYSWDEFTALPSRLSAKIEDRQARQEILEAVSRHGCYTNYKGIRVKKSGELFMMEDGVIWQLLDEQGKHHGQAASFTQWTAVR